MGLATSFLQGSKEEWSLVRRHPSEKVFGVQVAGNKPNTLVPTAEVIGKELAGNVDFVDINCGCPIDLVFKSGSGSARESSLVVVEIVLTHELVSPRRSGEARTHHRGHEQGARRYSGDCEAPNGGQGRQKHCSQADATVGA